jgi:hypothetical protein
VELVDPASEGAGVGKIGDRWGRVCAAVSRQDGSGGFFIRFFPVRRADGTGFFDVRTIF